MPTGIIESLDHEARGVTRLEGRTVFVEGALPGELVEYASYRRKPGYEVARAVQVLQASVDRVAPRCPHFGVCGGCSMQHLDPAAQVAAKQRLLEDNLWHIGRIRAEELYAPIHGQAWGYRYRARLSVRFVAKKGGVLVGFHERKSSYVADMRQCAILPPHLSALLLPLRELIGGLSIRERLPQIEVAVGERITALVLRVLEPPTPADAERLREFADRHRVVFYQQPQGPATAWRFHPLADFIAGIAVGGPQRVRGCGVFLTAHPEGVPRALLHNLNHNQVLHERVVVLNVAAADVPHVPEAERVRVEALGQGFHRLHVAYGFKDEPDLPRALALCAAHGLSFDLMSTSFFLGRDTVVRLPPGHPARMANWRQTLFNWMFRNADTATEFFKLPPNRVVELGAQVELC